MSDQVSTGIERIPVELWHEIFEYFDLNGLWYSFRRLNRRIDVIIDQIRLDLNFRSRGAYTYYVENIRRSINPAHIRSLSFHEAEEVSHFFSSHPLKSLVQLRKLSLKNMSLVDDPIFEFWNKFPAVQYSKFVEVGHNWRFRSEKRNEVKECFIRSIFNDDFCPALKSLWIETGQPLTRESFFPSLLPSTNATELEHFSIDFLSFDDLMTLLPGMGNIKSFCITLCLSDTREVIKTPLPVDTPFLPKCLHLKVKLDDNLKFQHVECLLGQTPNLKGLFLWGWSHLIDAQKWQLILSKHCPRLTKFELNSTGKVLKNVVRRFERERWTNSFWLERNTVTVFHPDSIDDVFTDFMVQFDARKKRNGPFLTLTGWV